MKNKFFGDKFTLRILTVAIFIVLAIAGLAFSLYLFIIAKNTYMYVVATAFATLSVVSGFFNISASILYYRSYFYGKYISKIRRKLRPMLSYPSVAVVVPVYNEDSAMVEDTLSNLRKLEYPQKSLNYYLLDDSTNAEIRSEMMRIAKENKFTYMHRDNRKGFKAGALNNFVSSMKEEFIAIFDYDERLTNPKFLKDLLPYFQDPNLSYIQTEKTHRKANLFADSINIFDGFFFKFIEPARALNNTAIFAGSCGIIRVSALRDIGGFPEYVIEDTFFSFKSDLYNYKSLYVPKVYALGKPIKKFTELVKQQWRYNYGDTQFIKYFFKNRKSMKGSPISSMDYLTHGFGLNYISVILIMFTIVSIFIVFSAVPFVNLNIDPRTLKSMMAKMGIKSSELNADKVIISCADKDIVITDPQVTMIEAQGTKSFQIAGTITENEKSVSIEISEDDVKMVMESSGASEEDARKALEDSNGDIAKAILELKK